MKRQIMILHQYLNKKNITKSLKEDITKLLENIIVKEKI